MKATKRMLNAFYYMTTGFMLGLLADLGISTNIWLEMRIHTHTPIWVLSLIGLIYGLLKRRPAGRYTFFASEILMLGLYLLMGKQDLILYNLRDGFMFLESIDNTRIFFYGMLIVTNIVNIGIINKFESSKG